MLKPLKHRRHLGDLGEGKDFRDIRQKAILIKEKNTFAK